VAREEAVGDPSLKIFSDDQVLDECHGSVLVDTISTSLQWLARLVQNRGDRLEAGQVILTGSIPGLHPIQEACMLRVEAPPFGSVEASVV